MIKINTGLFLLVLLVVPICQAQYKSKLEQTSHGIILTLSEINPTYKDVVSNGYTIRDYYNYTEPKKNGLLKLPYLEITVALPYEVKPEIKVVDKNEIKLDGILLSVNPNVELKNDSTLVDVPNDYSRIYYSKNNFRLLEEPAYFWLRGIYCMRLRINTHKYNLATKQLNIVNSIKLSIDFPKKIRTDSNISLKQTVKNDADIFSSVLNYENVERTNQSMPVQLSDSLSEWINYNNSYVKFSVSANTIFRIKKIDLVNKGISNLSFDPRTIKIYQSGKEIPVYVKGEQDGSFDEEDYIEFFGGQNYPKKSHRIINNDNEEYNEYLNRYTDSLYFFLTWGSENGNRVHVQNLDLVSEDTLDYFKQIYHFESNTMLQNLNGDELANQYPDWNKNKTWYREWVFTGAKNYQIKLDNIYKNKSARVLFKLVSGGSSISTKAHQILLKVNNVKIDSQVVDRFKQVLLSNTMNSSSLIEGNNQFTISNLSNGTSPNFLALDWYEVEYPKLMTAQRDSLFFTLDETLPTKVRTIKVKNVSTSDIVVYKTKPFLKKIESYKMSGNQLIFADTTSGMDQYIFIPTALIQSPTIIYTKKFVNLRDVNRSAEYIAITHSSFLKSAQDYVANIADKYEANAVVIKTEDIFDEFSFGYPYPEAIRSFLSSTLKFWKSPKPLYLTLIGDADYDYKKFRFKSSGVLGGGNFVPSFGFPVSDNWFALLNANVSIPQMIVGRIPINTGDELARYSQKIDNYFNSASDGWNKKYLFFSGGNASNSSEIALFKTANDSVISRYVKSAPVGGEVHHFYKTISPQSDFGPFTSAVLNGAIDDGAIVISYLGHSGTATWDNSINEITQLKNKTNRNPLIVDFGCSTNKFAEPDIVCFGERFLLATDGQAIGYVGNSSLGFSSSSLLAPFEFFSVLSKEPGLSQGNALMKTKISIVNNLGSSFASKIFALTSTLLGDPIIKLKLPANTNLHLDENSFLSRDSYLSELNDSVLVKYFVQNYGTADSKQQYKISFTQKYNGKVITNKSVLRIVPFITDTLAFWIKAKGYPGENELNLILNTDNTVTESSKDDNMLRSTINIYSASLRDIVTSDNQNSFSDYLNILNPVTKIASTANITFEIAALSNFQTATVLNFSRGEFYTKVSLPALQNQKRYWYRFKMDDPNSQFSKPKSFYLNKSPKFYLNDKYSFLNQDYLSTSYSASTLKLNTDTMKISVTSAGAYVGSTCVIAQNGMNVLTNSYFAGMALAIYDEKTLQVEFSDWYQLFNNTARMKELVTKINTIQEGKIVVMGVADDAANNITVDLKNAIKTLGSTKIDSLKFQGSWALIGKKASTPSNVIEKVRGPYNGLIQLEKKYPFAHSQGTFTTQSIGPASKWKNVIISSGVKLENQFKLLPIGITKDGVADTLNSVQFDNNQADISKIDVVKYPYLKLRAEINSSLPGSLTINAIGVNYIGVPELGTNYQVVSLSKDSLDQGETANLNFSVYNVGESTASNFKIRVDIVKKDNSKEMLFEQLVDSVQTEKKKDFNLSYTTDKLTGSNQFQITIDPDNSVTELYKDNNFYSVPFYVKPNNKPASLKLAIDGSDIINGDFISSKPNFKIELSDESLIPITDTTKILLYLNNKRLYFASNNNIINYNYSSSNPKMVVNYTPTLSDGDYTFKVVGKNATDQLIDSTGIVRKFTVKNELQLLNAYNYPNPFKDDTYFTFKLTQIPDELKIIIYTIAGRKIKEIKLSAAELKFDFNRIFWDGRDQDGDLAANGVYLYKIISQKGSEKTEVTEKLAIIR